MNQNSNSRYSSANSERISNMGHERNSSALERNGSYERPAVVERVAPRTGRVHV